MICVVIPCYKSKRTIMSVIQDIGPEVTHIIAVDDACPENTGLFIQKKCVDERVEVIFHHTNQGVGGACMTGFKRAMSIIGCKIVVKLDSDGQMDPKFISFLIKPIQRGYADYTKGNRFFNLDFLAGMPWARIFGNSTLSLISKFSSGYWEIMDPTNGFFAIHTSVLAALPLHKIDKRYFFESDMLFRLNILSAVIEDIPMHAKYADEKSSLSVRNSILRFSHLHLNRFLKRIFYTYFLRGFNIGSVNLTLGLGVFLSGLLHGWDAYSYHQSLNIETPTGTIVIVALKIILGFQMLLSFINYDTNNVKRTAVHHKLNDRKPQENT